VVFTGVVRSPNKGREVTGIFYDCYKDMAENEMARIIAEVKSGHPIESVTVIHRIGEVAVGEVALLVAVTAPHRGEAFAASQTIIDELKRRVPIWKKEHYEDTEAKWL
jgi:molybdopterin synthase catalytic subunit